MYPDGFKCEPTKRTPWIIMEPGKIFILGRSIPENPGLFFTPAYEWILQYSHNFSGFSDIHIGFEYINTTSTKWIYLVLKALSELRNIQTNAKIIWYYERGDDDMCELGFILRSVVDCPFLVVEVEEMNTIRYESIIKGS